ncbi:hypothetical protein E4U14_005389 [Claviceps sp. LM454 group G7]|nr:hypothetical protein E4U14_005389 [Claviceps sp. LM454 group G7]
MPLASSSPGFELAILNDSIYSYDVDDSSVDGTDPDNDSNADGTDSDDDSSAENTDWSDSDDDSDADSSNSNY